MFFYKESDHARQITKTTICSASAFFCFILHLYKIYTKVIGSISHLEVILKMGSLKNSPLLARRSSHWEVFCKNAFLFCQVSILWTLVDLFWTKSLLSLEIAFFANVILPEIRKGSFYQEFRCCGARNKLRTGAFPRIFSYSTELLDLPGQCKCLSVSSFRVKKNAIVFPRSKQLPKRNN